VKVLILGIDGYLGWSLALHLADRAHVVGGIDNFMRRSWVTKMGSVSAIPIAEMADRRRAFTRKFGSLYFQPLSMEDYPGLCNVLQNFQPDAIVHLAECPSAPYSMSGPHEAAFVMRNNVIGTLYLLHAMREHAPDAHLLKLGTMGEYGTPDVPIPEGFFNLSLAGRTAPDMPFPRNAGSWYHWTKVHDSMNVMWATKLWGLRSTDIMQGVVYGGWLDSMFGHRDLRTRLDFDEAFGTAIHRFVCQAIVHHPLTIYGDIGKQTRGFLPLADSMQCLTLALENPPDAGEYRVFNQFEDVYSILQLAQIVEKVGNAYGLQVQIGHYEPPRAEAQEHYYQPAHQHLLDLGYQPDHDIEHNVAELIETLTPHRERIAMHREVLIPSIRWQSNTRARARYLGEQIGPAAAE